MGEKARLQDAPVNIRMKLAGLWTSLMFCYIYCDYFELYQPGKLQGMLAAKTALGPVSQGVLMGMSALLLIPSLMIFLSLALPATFNRWLNVAMGLLYTVVMVLAIQGAWRYYVLFGIVEMLLTLTITWYAWKWPRIEATAV
jgi:hypothetical protein